MTLEKELGLKNGIRVAAHEALLNIYYTGDLLRKKARDFFMEFGITDVQFNLLELLYYQGGERGLSQADLSRMLLVNRSNITSLIDRMERGKLVVRTDIPEDRRYYAIKLTAKGKKIVENVEDAYMEEVKSVMKPLNKGEMKTLITFLERIRENLQQ